MKSYLSAVWLLALLVVLAACDSGKDAENDAVPDMAVVEGPSSEALSAAITELADEYVRVYFETFPEQALFSGAVDPDPARLSDHSLDSLARWQIFQQDLLAQLDEIDPSEVNDPAAVLTANFLRNQLESARDLAVCRMELWTVSPTWTGWLAEFTALAGKLELGTPQQREAALSRLSQIPDYIDADTANLKEGVELGYTAADNSARAVLEVVDAFLALPVTDTPFAIAAQDQDIGFQQQVASVVAEGIRPAMQRYRDYLANEYRESAREAIGVDANPDGEACYRAAVRYWATVDLSAEEIHRIGLAQMDKVMAEISEIGARSFGESDPLVVLETVKTEPQYLFTSRQEMVEYGEAALARAEVEVPYWFGRISQAPVIVEPYPEFQEKSAPGGQAEAASADGSKPGKYLINTYQAEKQSRAILEATAFHEAYPGHHTQFTIAQERNDLHPISRYFFLSGFGEGWALYTERLADEMGLYSSDLDRLGMLSNEAWRAARMVVDSGMHGLGWSRQQALDYLNAHTANLPDLNAAEIDRYIAVPGQATSYMLGNLEIRRLRELAEAELGEQFDIRAFHDLVLEDGAIPLDQLGAKVQRWIAVQQP
ncbi:MAG TPA: DUF885 domain-containing protein [Xanthomonadales bacterium]|nr:DUF885 domain-containing protein [Xanthomonadales bacterium]